MSQSFTHLSPHASFLCPCPLAASTDIFSYILFSTSSSWPLFFFCFKLIYWRLTMLLFSGTRELKVGFQRKRAYCKCHCCAGGGVYVWVYKERDVKKESVSEKIWWSSEKERWCCLQRVVGCSLAFCCFGGTLLVHKRRLFAALFYFSVVSVERSNCCAFLTALRLSVWEFSLIIVVRDENKPKYFSFWCHARRNLL